MTVWFLLMRELRAHARRAFTHWARVFVAGALSLGGVWLAADLVALPGRGGALFQRIHCLLYCAAWLLVPLAASDCLSRERREGTLMLLFLTPMPPAALALAKIGAHTVQLAIALLAGVPVLMIPVLLGGIHWRSVAWLALVLMNVACWSLGLTLAASSVSRSGPRALALAVLLEGAAFVLFPWIFGALLGVNSLVTWQQGYSQASYDFFTGFSLLATPAPDFAAFVQWAFPPAHVLHTAATMTVISVSVFVLSVIFAGQCLRRNWREAPTSRLAGKMKQALCRPILGKTWLRHWMRRLLERNPPGWLERRQWSGRLIIWTWLAVVGSVYGFLLSNWQLHARLAFVDQVMVGLLLVSLATVAAGSFRRERETGVLELLLVSPLQVRQIIHGRLRGIWGQFLPATGMLLGIWMYLASAWTTGSRPGGPAVGSFLVSYAILPVVGLYFSLQCRSYLMAWVLTLGGGLWLPDLLAGLGELFWPFALEPKINDLLVALLQVSLAGVLYRRLHRKLERRQFPVLRNAR
ncbi:MAG TPA: ABC transporter permease subunit [Verrucomicrobiota bacterium]|nr:ABC transporter permease subunit [Verrucomicrobiota bacterium]HNT15772.1 ABC transporter permease subunit [Verrucomicrobiota bacterium]